MKRALNHLKDAFIKGRFSLLLLTLVLMFFILPLIPVGRTGIDRLLSGFGILVVLSCMRVVVQNRAMLVFIIALGLLNIVFNGMDVIHLPSHRTLIVFELFSRLLYYLLIFFNIMRHVLDRSEVTADKICGAVSSYLLIGIIWAILYGLFYVFNPDSFSLPVSLQSNEASGYWTLYFSFVSLTTIGYGDITPLSPAAQTYAYLEAACGQIFLTVLIARLVALHIIHSNNADQ